MTITIHFGFLWLVFFGSLIWLPLCWRIGNLLQREWWFNVLAFSFGITLVSALFAIAWTLATIDWR